uniref:T-box domain-containing protein n=1 Tax=Plectus sambesii TaxID=2011161 RepID=A0A914W2I1_9BILA
MQTAVVSPASPSLAPSSDVKIELENAELWRRFHEHTTEMIVTKTGRRMFPTLRYRLSGLDPNATYAVLLEMESVSDCRYKFQNGRWVVAGRADPPPLDANHRQGRTYTHPDSPAPGRIWMRQPLSFHRIKLTNNLLDQNAHIHLSSMHRYVPRVIVVKLHEYFTSMPQVVASASFPETDFIAVTAYQNEKVIQLKIDHNPFAKGFRDNGGAERHKRPLSQSSCDTGRESSDEPPTTKRLIEQQRPTMTVVKTVEPETQAEDHKSVDEERPTDAVAKTVEQAPPAPPVMDRSQLSGDNQTAVSAINGACSPWALVSPLKSVLPSPVALGSPWLSVAGGGWPGAFSAFSPFGQPALHPFVASQLQHSHSALLAAAAQTHPFLIGQFMAANMPYASNF